jgi:hypothetical protein
VAYAKDTTVTPERSRAEIEQTLRRYGADAFSFAFDGERAAIAFRMNERMVRFEVIVPPLSEFRYAKGYRSRTETQQRAARDKIERQRWRALLLVIKAKLEAVESKIETFDEAFMPHLTLPDGSRFGDWAAPQIAEVYETGQMPDLLPASRPQLVSGNQQPMPGDVEGTIA